MVATISVNKVVIMASSLLVIIMVYLKYFNKVNQVYFTTLNNNSLSYNLSNIMKLIGYKKNLNAIEIMNILTEK